MAAPRRPWSASDWPREKLLEHGAATLSNAELLALLLGTGETRAGQRALNHSHTLLSRYGDSFRALADVSLPEFCAVKGVGPAKAAQLLAVFEIAKRFSQEEWRQGVTFGSSVEVFHHYREHLGSLKKETFYVVLLDAKHRKLKDVRVSEGSLTSSLVHPREVFRPIIRESAAAAILVHNHPSGDPLPSQEDLTVTRRLRQVGEVMGVNILDHLIIGKGRYVSFVDDGYWT